MQRYVIVDTTSDKIITVVEYDTAPSNPPPGFDAGVIAIQHDTAGGDWTYNGTALVAPPAVVYVPQMISRRQFFQQLAVQGVITQAEAIAVLGAGTMPPELQTVLNALPAAQQFAASCFLLAAGDILRTHLMTLAIGTAYGWSSAQIDALFTAAALL